MISRTAALVAGWMLLSVLPLPGQSVLPHTDTRTELNARLDSLQAILDSWSGSEDRWDEISRTASHIQTRLEEGDFRPGDVLRLQVTGNDDLSGTYRLGQDVQFRPGSLPAVSLEGLLFAEARDHIERELSKYLREPRVKVEPLIRIGVLGAVQSPGFYDLPPGATIADALMEAGGVTSNAEVEGLKYGKDGRKIVSEGGADPTRLTMVDLASRDGGRIYVPSGGGSFFRDIAPFLGLVGTVTVLITRI